MASFSEKNVTEESNLKNFQDLVVASDACCDHIETTTQRRLGWNTEQTAVVLLANKYD